MIEAAAGPVRGVVALRAILRESRLDVIGITGTLEVRLMAGVARRAIGQVVSARRTERGVVALRALQRHVRTR